MSLSSIWARQRPKLSSAPFSTHVLIHFNDNSYRKLCDYQGSFEMAISRDVVASTHISVPTHLDRQCEECIARFKARGFGRRDTTKLRARNWAGELSIMTTTTLWALDL